VLKGKGRYGFKVGKYDKDKVLYIDPLLASTYLGGSVGDWVNAIAIDSVGNVYVTGETFSTDFPVTAGAYDTTFSGNATLWIGDAFISKLDGNLSTLLASTYLGGSGDDWVSAIAIDSVGNVYVTGETFSTDFPVTVGAYDTTFSGNATLWIGDAFISKLDSNLSSGVPPTTTSTLPSSFSSGGGGGGGCTINPKANDIGLGIPLLILACLLWTRRRHLLAKKK